MQAKIEMDISGSEKEKLLVLTADSEESLSMLISSCRSYLQSYGENSDSLRMLISASSQLSKLPWRLAVVARSPGEMMAALDAALAGRLQGNDSRGRATTQPAPRVALVFSGQGSEWAGMGAGLLETSSIFRRTIEACDQAMRPYIDWSLTQVLGDSSSWSADIDVVQPCIFAMQLGLAELWREYGVVADAVVGHSIGEVAAAQVSGALTLAAAAEVICRQSRLFRGVRGTGTLLYVELASGEAARWLAAQPSAHRGDAAIAIEHSRSATVLAGATSALAALAQDLDRSQIPWRWLAVDVPAHHPGLAAACRELERELLGSGFVSCQPRVPFYSARTGAPIGPEPPEPLDARYWRRASTEPVRLVTAVERMIADGFDTFVEVSPHPLVLSTLEELTREASTLGSLICHGVTTIPVAMDTDSNPTLFSAAVLALQGATGHDSGRPQTRPASVVDLLPGRLARARTVVERCDLLERYLCDELAAVLEVASTTIDLDAPLRELGLDSVMAVRMRARLRDATGLGVSATVVWSYPSVRTLAAHLAGLLTAPTLESPELAKAGHCVQYEIDIDRVAMSELEQLLLAEIHIAEARVDAKVRR
jgi:acyl transferase domain-containing protein/acyl carrier protein